MPHDFPIPESEVKAPIDEQKEERFLRLAEENSRMGQQITELKRQADRSRSDDELKFWETAFMAPPLGSCTMEDRINSADLAVIARRSFLQRRTDLPTCLDFERG
jgi:hypothetical protein